MAVAATEQLETQYQFVDDLPDVAAVRAVERENAQEVMDTRRLRQQQGLAPVEAPVDPMSTARFVRLAEDPIQQAQHYEGLRLDCQRLVGEWFRKKKSEYFPPLRHSFDEESQEFFSHGLSIKQMTENALLPIADDSEEEQRRINERVEDATPQVVRGLGHIAIGQSIRTISECTDSAISSYEYDQKHGLSHRGYRGYVPEIQKLMIRDIRFDENSNDRYEEQVGLPGTYLTHEIITMTLESNGAQASHMGKTELHGSQLLVSDDLMTFAKKLDDTASEAWCTNIFMGEEVPKDFVKDYDNFRAEALQRQAGLTGIADSVAEFVMELDSKGATREEALVLVEDFVKLELGELGKQDKVAAEQMFDAKTAAGLGEVSMLEAAGRFREAEAMFNQVMKAAPGGGSCGSGSCGLERVTLSSDLAKDLGMKSGDKTAKDTVRSCKSCGHKSLVYAFTDVKVNTLCTRSECGAFKSKASIVPTTQRNDYTLAA